MADAALDLLDKAISKRIERERAFIDKLVIEFRKSVADLSRVGQSAPPNVQLALGPIIARINKSADTLNLFEPLPVNMDGSQLDQLVQNTRNGTAAKSGKYTGASYTESASPFSFFGSPTPKPLPFGQLSGGWKSKRNSTRSSRRTKPRFTQKLGF